MTIVIFGVGVLVFFLTVYGTVIAGGLQLTREQMKSSPELTAKIASDPKNPEGEVPTRDIIRADY
ncbi:MAG: hypothetical protein ACI83Y_001523 [Candidatus Azotimanducaceae bacterium]|jgi:hypothetical protein|tara:strand:- start:5715 stop:5909 length:195 start_codon:yes stop_codon:yes gene_type:complete